MLIRLISMVALAILLCVTSAKADDGDVGNRLKHGIVGAAFSGAITELCERNIHLTDGSRAQWGCFWLGVIPTIIGASIFEAIQDDRRDAQGDVMAAGAGAIIGSTISIAIDF